MRNEDSNFRSSFDSDPTGRKRHVGRTSHELHAPQVWEKGTASSAITNDGPQGADLELINEWKAECELNNQLGVENMCAMAE